MYKMSLFANVNVISMADCSRWCLGQPSDGEHYCGKLDAHNYLSQNRRAPVVDSMRGAEED